MPPTSISRLYTRPFRPVKSILATLLFVAGLSMAVYGKDLGVDSSTITSLNCSAGCTVAGRASQVTFILNSSATGTIAGGLFSNPPDSSITLKAPTGDKIADIACTVGAGTIRVVRTQ